MHVHRIYGDNYPTEISEALKYQFSEGLVIPDKYKKEWADKRIDFDPELLKPEIDYILKSAPLNVLPFCWGTDMSIPYIMEAVVGQYAGKDGHEIPRHVEIYFNCSIEMVEPDLTKPETRDRVLAFRSLPAKDYLCFESGKKFGDISEKDFFDLYIHRFYP